MSSTRSGSSRRSRSGRSSRTARRSPASASSPRPTTCAGGPTGRSRSGAGGTTGSRASARSARRREAELEEELTELLTDATRIRLRADVPVAAYLSGGLDSSVTAALASKLYPGTLNSFGVGFRDPLFDESEFQDRFVRELGTDLTRVVVDSPDIAELLPRAVELSEKPTLRTALTPLLRLSRAVREAGLKVVITGEGADELFGGYDIYRENKVRRFWAKVPDSEIRPLLFASAERVPREGPEALGRIPRRLLQARARGRRRPAVQPSAALREHRPRTPPPRPGAARAGGARGRRAAPASRRGCPTTSAS